jgi:hypothetical protein
MNLGHAVLLPISAADPDETLCYCVMCDNKTSVDQLKVLLEGEENGA